MGADNRPTEQRAQEHIHIYIGDRSIVRDVTTSHQEKEILLNNRTMTHQSQK